MFFQVQHKPTQHDIPGSAGNLQQTSGRPSLPSIPPPNPFAAPTRSAQMALLEQIPVLKLDISVIQAWLLGIQQAGGEAYSQKWEREAFKIIYHLSVIWVQVSNTHSHTRARTHTQPRVHTYTQTHTETHSCMGCTAEGNALQFTAKACPAIDTPVKVSPLPQPHSTPLVFIRDQRRKHCPQRPSHS